MIFYRSTKVRDDLVLATHKDQLYLIIIGHVDAGKSTLMGHLLYKLGHIQQRTIQKYEHESKKLGKQSFVYAWVLDETEEERYLTHEKKKNMIMVCYLHNTFVIIETVVLQWTLVI